MQAVRKNPAKYSEQEEEIQPLIIPPLELEVDDHHVSN